VQPADVLSDRYVIERQIARGGMATVYLARDIRHGSHVAIKLLHPAFGALLGEARFTREIQVTARLQHPNILPIFDSGRVADVPYYVMPYVDGESLAQRITREGQLPVDDAVEIACEVADALAHAHAEGFVHRDVKPGNILLAHGHAMLADFGVARIAELTRSQRLTETGFALGTPTYMSPEQAAAGEVDGRSDVYSLGCVLYEMLAGHPPFSGPNSHALIARHLTDPLPSVHTVRPTVGAPLEAVLRRATAKAPADRFAGAAQFRDALRHLAAPVPEASSASPGSERLRWIAGASVPLVLALALSVAWFARSGYRGTTVTAPADPSRIAVLYFDDESPQHDMGYLADGLTERLIQALSMVPAIHVISRNGVERYRGRPVSLDSLRGTLRVGSVVEGSVQRSGDRVRVNVQLVDANTGDQITAHTVEHAAGDLFALEDDVTAQVSDLLRQRLGQSVHLREIQEGTRSQLARELLLRADQARNDATAITQRRHPGEIQDAVAFLWQGDSLLARAMTADSEWAAPVVTRGWLMLDLAALPGSGTTRLRALQRALAYAEQALRRAPRDADALELHGTTLWRLVDAGTGAATDAARLQRAEQDLRAAVAIRPTQASAWSTLSRLLRLKGSLAEANVAARRALGEDAYLENAPDIVEQLYRSELLLGDDRAAARSCADGHRRFPNDWRFVECRLTIMLFDTAMVPDPRAAWALVATLDATDLTARDTALPRQYGPVFRHMAAAAISARAGERDTALATIAWARQRVRDDSSAAVDLDYDEAYVRLALGDRARALALLDEFLVARPTYRAYIARDPLFTRLRGDQRFTALLRTPPA